MRTLDLKLISFCGQIIVTNDFKTKKKRHFHSKNMSDFAFKTTQSKSSYYYLRYYSRSSTFCGRLLDSGPSNVRHAMKTFVVLHTPI